MSKQYLLRNRYLIVGLASVSLLLLADLIKQAYHDATGSGDLLMYLLRNETWTNFLKELGVAGAVALIASFSIEYANRKEFGEAVETRIAEIQKNVFNSTFGRSIPDGIVDEISEILNHDFVRESHRAMYRMAIVDVAEICPGAASAKLMRVEVTTTYRIKNISRVPATLNVVTHVDKPPYARLHEHTRIVSVKIDDQELTSIEMDAADKRLKDTDDFKRFEHEISDVEPGQQVTVATQAVTFKNLDDVEIFRSLKPSDGLVVGAHFPKEVRHFSADALHRLGVVTNSKTDDYAEWMIKSPTLPQQGIVFWWRCSDLQEKNDTTR